MIDRVYHVSLFQFKEFKALRHINMFCLMSTLYSLKSLKYYLGFLHSRANEIQGKYRGLALSPYI